MDYENEGYRMAVSTFQNEDEIIAAVKLPDGVNITKIKVFAYSKFELTIGDSKTREDCILHLRRTQRDNTFSTMASTYRTVTIPGDSNFSAESAGVVNSVIDNRQFGYYLGFTAILESRLYGAVIEYTYHHF
jgi:hypothetical protein